MRRLTHPMLLLATVMFTPGCTSQDRPARKDQPAGPGEALELARQSEAVDALRQLGANVARDEQGRVKVLRLSGPKITDAELKHVAVLTELRALYLQGTRVTDAGMVHLEPLRKLERLHWVGRITKARGLRTLQELKAPTHVEFIDCPLLDVLDTLEDYHQVPFEIDQEALEAADCPPDVPVTAKHVQVPLREALTSILGSLELAWTIEDGALVVTTEEALAKKWPNLAKLRKVVPTLRDVTIDFQAGPQPASEP